MPISKKSFKGIIISLLLFISFQSKSQIQDTVLVDYNAFSCNICNDPDYSCFGTDSVKFVDSAHTSLQLVELKFLFLHTPCTSSPTTLLLNGDTMGSFNNSYSCQCNSCTMDSVVVTGAKLASYIKNDTNSFEYRGGSSLCIARYMIIRTWRTSTDYDMATIKLTKPILSCPGSADIEVRVGNYGLKQVDSVELHWKWNGVTQTTVKDTGLIDTLGGSNPFTKEVQLGTKTLVKGKIDTLIAWTEKPNGSSDTINDNDTIMAYVVPAFKDTITVGGSSPDFTKVQDAIDALMQFGVCGPVIVRIASGSYNEQLVIGHIPGTDTSNTVTFESVAKDSSTVTIYYSGTSTENRTLFLDKTGHLRFRHLTIEATSSSYARVVEFGQNINDVGFYNCQFRGVTTTSSSNSRALIYASSSSIGNSMLTFQNCFFHRGAYGISCSNSFVNRGMGYLVNSCRFTDQYYRNIELRYCEDVEIVGCQLERPLSAASFGHNMYFGDCYGQFDIINNTIISFNGGTGVEFASKNGDSSNQTNIINNFISVTSPYYTSCRPMYLYYGENINVFYNSLFAETPSSSNDAFYIYRGDHIELRNNSCFNKNAGRALYNSFLSQNVIVSDHNNWYTLGSSLAYWNSSIADLNALQTATSMDSSSKSVDPNYKSSSDLHASSVELNGNAKPISGISDDIDGEARNATTPDIGADEFKLPPIDAGLVELKKFKADSTCVNVVLRNLGDDTLTSASIAWTLNGVTQTTYSWTGSLKSGDTAIVCIGTKKFKRDSVYNFKIWSSSPNGVTDTINGNDTITKTVYPALCGTYTIGGTSPDYPTFSAAIVALKNGGVLDSAKFKVRDGTYTEQLVFTKIECADNKDQVIFESESLDSTKVLLTYSTASWSNNYVIYLNGADGISFRHMTIKNSSSYYRRVVYMENGSDHIIFRNNQIENDDSVNTSTTFSLIYNSSTNDNDLCLINNFLLHGSYGYYGYGSSSDFDRNLLIRGNRFKDQGYQAIFCIYQQNMKIERNHVTAKSNNFYAGLNCDEIRGATIDGNQIYCPMNSERYGMYLNDFDYGDSSWITNNMISAGGANTYSYGLYVEDFTANMLFHNSVLTNFDDTTNSGAVFIEGGSHNSSNNIFEAKKGGHAFYFNWGTLKSDYNNLRSGGSKLTYWNGTTYNSLASHVSGTNNDSNSIDVNPAFNSSTDLHVKNPAIDRTGKYISSVKVDIDGESRDTVPDVGADEFVPAKYDIGVSDILNPGEVFAAGSTSIKVVVYNFGTDTVFSGTVKSKINHDTLADKAFSDTLVSGDTIHVTVGSFNFHKDSIYNMAFWTVKPNSVTDQKMINDSTIRNNQLPALRGEYTLGGSSPDFTSFTDAINALNKRGIVDSVKFKVRNGTYTEQLVLTNVKGAGHKNSIIFEGENGDSSLVTLTFASTKFDTNYVVQFDGADGFTFRKLGIKSTGTSYGRVLHFTGGSDWNCIENCFIEGPAVTYTSDYMYLIYSAGSTDENNTFKNNYIHRGSAACYFQSTSSYNQRAKGNCFEGNTVRDFYTYGIYTYYQKGVKIIGNDIQTNTNNSFYYGIFQNYNTDTFVVARNRVFLEKSGTPHYLNNCGYNSSDSNLIINNMYSVGKPNNSIYGIYYYWCFGIRTAHNSIFLGDNPATGSYGLYLSGNGGGNHVYNNIVNNQARGGLVYLQNSSTVDEMDHNIFNQNGSFFGYYNGNTVNDLPSWRSSTMLDSNSSKGDPIFVSNSDLHTTNVDLDATVMRLPYVLNDFDQESRNSNTEPGADEFALKTLDAGIAKILTPNSPFKSDTQYVEVVLKNYGLNDLTSVDINWILNGVTGTVFNYSDTLKSKDTAHVKIERKFFHIDSTFSLKAWTSNPNSGTDGNAANDTQETVDQYPALSGPYTIGGASPDFATFTDAITALKRGGIVDSVVFNVRNGTYTEQITIPRILGANRKGSICFQSTGTNNTSNVILKQTSTSWTNNWVLRLDSAKGITFKNLTIENSSGSYSRLINIRNHSTLNSFESCYFKGNQVSTGGSTNQAIVYSEIINGHNNHENCFIGNTFSGGSYAIYMYGYNNNVYDKNWLIKSNIFTNNYSYGIYVQYASNLKVISNTITNDGTYRTSINYGASLRYCRDSFECSKNIISGKMRRALDIYSFDGTSSLYGLIANNMISSTEAHSYILLVQYCNYLNIYNNSMLAAAPTGNNRAFQSVYGGNLRLVNNIMYDKGVGYAWYSAGNTNNFNRINYNNYFGAGTNLAYVNGSNIANFAGLKSTTNKDTNSLNVNPSFVSDTDLHAREITLNEGGTKLSEITMDIDGELRDTLKPDIGADEFEPPSPNDAGISEFLGPLAPFKYGTRNVDLAIKNFGSDTLKSASVSWKVNGTNQTSYSWTGVLAPGALDTFTVGTYNFPRVDGHTIVAWTTNPNGVTDTTNYNDTTTKQHLYAALDTNYSIGASGADFPDFSTAAFVLQKAGVIDTVNFLVQTGTYTEQFEIGTYAGSSPNRPVSFVSQTGDSTDVTLTKNNSSNATNYLVKLTGADYLSFKQMTFKPTSSNYSRVFDISSGSNGLQILNSKFVGHSSPAYYASAFVFSSTDNDDSTRIENNVFSEGNRAIQLFGLSASNPEKGIIIKNNEVSNTNQHAINCTYQESLIITENEILLKNNFNSKIGILTSNTRNDLEISCNKITGYGRYDQGIYCYHNGAFGAKGIIKNNMISLNSNTSGRYGIQLYYSDYVDVYFNSVNIYGSTYSNNYAFYVYYGADIIAKNNIFANRCQGYSVYRLGTGISQSDYNDLYTNGTNLGYWSGNITDLSAWQSASSMDANSVSTDPLFTSNTNLHVYISSLDSAATPISGITQDIDKNTRNTTHPDIGADEFNSLLNNVGVSKIDGPVDDCELGEQEIKVTVFNYGSQQQHNFPIYYQINGGTAVKDTVTDTIGPGGFKAFTFTKKFTFSNFATYSLKTWTELSTDQDASNDSAGSSIQNYSKPAMVSNMFPLNLAKDIDYPISFSWSPASGASKYDLYIWDDTASSRPTSPFKSDVSQISTQITGGLTYGRTYKWQVVSKNSICGTDGPIQKFTMRHLPNLIVESVSSPTTAFSGNSISVSWKVKNTGLGTTGSRSWYDLVYLSNDSIYDSADQRMGGVLNVAALDSNQNYSSNMNITLPNGISGTYYIIVRTDPYTYIPETDDGDNTGYDTSGMSVSLTPPPDLVVTAITKPNTAFSGSNANITYTVKNAGTGNTVATTWTDFIYGSQDSTFSTGVKTLGSKRRNMALDKDSTYKMAAVVQIPNFISGGYYIFVQTDRYNQVYEHTNETNNRRRSDSIRIILSPPPDLIVDALVLPDTASPTESIPVKYDVINKGGGKTLRGFSAGIYISSSNVFNTSTASLITSKYISKMDADDTTSVSMNIGIPNSINGKHYFFVVADIYNAVNENTNEDNNVSLVDSIQIVSPDLIVNNLRTHKTDTTGDSIRLYYQIINQGKGNVVTKARTDRVYISSDDTFDIDSSIMVKDISYSTGILADDTIDRSAIVIIPDGYHGRRYFYVHTDFSETIFENGLDNNNRGRSDSVRIILAPYPDLVPDITYVQDTAHAGAADTVKFTVKNKGEFLAKKSWVDRIYLSTDTILNTTTDRGIQTILRADNLKVDSTYEIMALFTLPGNVPAGDYYYFVVADGDDNVYEHNGDTNNVARSEKLYVDGYPPVDLKAMSLTAPNTMSSGKSATVSWIVKNIGDAPTLGGFWDDCVYLSTDSIWNSNDRRIHTEQVNTTVQNDSTYKIDVSITIPNGLSGDYYMFVRADKTNANNDVDTSNNTQGKRESGSLVKSTINLTPPPDLEIVSRSVPSTGTAGQQIKVKWTTKNTGTGPTISSYWSDQVYLSTDYIIDNADQRLSNNIHRSILKKDSSYSDSATVFIPSNISGNYILIIATDAEDREYEFGSESNNIASSVITISKAPPADLVVDEVTTTDSIVSGDKITVDWKLKNIGTNPASGILTDNVYLSIDTIVDANDLLLGGVRHSIALTPSATTSKTLTATVSGVELGDYYVLVKTDVKNNINESNETNNSLHSELLNIDIPEIFVGITKSDTLKDNKEQLYRLHIADSLAGESLLLTLRGDSANGNNEIYLRKGQVPSRSEFDYGFRDPFAGNQEIIVPELDTGTYYLLAYGDNRAGSYQLVDILARILEFEIRNVKPISGGNTGQVTLKIEGSKFDENTDFSLVGEGGSISSLVPDEFEDEAKQEYNDQELDTFLIIDPTLAYVTFDLNGQEIGEYDVRGVNETDTINSDTATLTKGFEVVQGLPPDIQLDVTRPANARTNRIVSFDVNFSNEGNVDIVNGNLQIISNGTTPISFTIKGLDDNKTRLEIPLEEDEGIEGRLRPGGVGSVKIYSKATNTLGFTIVLPE